MPLLYYVHANHYLCTKLHVRKPNYYASVKSLSQPSRLSVARASPCDLSLCRALPFVAGRFERNAVFPAHWRAVT